VLIGIGNGADPALSAVDTKSTPDGAEITVDEKFMGSTPSSLRLAAGEHKIKLEKSGLQDLGKNHDRKCRGNRDGKCYTRKTRVILAVISLNSLRF
jgi:hypothetical protein